MKAKKFTLDYDEAQEFDVLAICSHLPDYRLVWTINKYAEIELSRCESPHLCYSKKGQLLGSHEQFQCFDEFTEVNYLLIKNREAGNTMASELEMVDYLLFINTVHQYPTEDLRKKIIQSDGIITAYQIDPDQIKSLTGLALFDE